MSFAYHQQQQQQKNTEFTKMIKKQCKYIPTTTYLGYTLQIVFFSKLYFANIEVAFSKNNFSGYVTSEYINILW